MAIWVSRYANQELRKGKYYPVGISIGRPKWNLGYELKDQCYSLAPKGYMLNYPQDRYREEYFDKLNSIGTGKIIDMVIRFEKEAREENKELVLLCYEDLRDPSQWCHRTMFAEWWLRAMGEIINELPDLSTPKIKKEPEVKEVPKEEFQQLSLF